MLVSALYNKQEFSILSSPKEYWVCGIVQAKLMKIMEEHLNFSEWRSLARIDCDDKVKC